MDFPFSFLSFTESQAVPLSRFINGVSRPNNIAKTWVITQSLSPA